jgi:hypothetical protein
MVSDKLVFCPKCKKPVEARDYFSTDGVSDWRVEGTGTFIRCQKCGYSGPPLEAPIEDYKKMMEKKK